MDPTESVGRQVFEAKTHRLVAHSTEVTWSGESGFAKRVWGIKMEGKKNVSCSFCLEFLFKKKNLFW